MKDQFDPDQENQVQADRQQLLEAAFELVRPASHWKDPIDATVPSDQLRDVFEAIIHFTATTPVVDYLGLVNGNHMLRIRAAGYRAGPAGDH